MRSPRGGCWGAPPALPSTLCLRVPPGKECDLNRQCGVRNPDTNKLCTRLLTCKVVGNREGTPQYPSLGVLGGPEPPPCCVSPRSTRCTSAGRCRVGPRISMCWWPSSRPAPAEGTPQRTGAPLRRSHCTLPCRTPPHCCSPPVPLPAEPGCPTACTPPGECPRGLGRDLLSPFPT